MATTANYNANEKLFGFLQLLPNIHTQECPNNQTIEECKKDFTKLKNICSQTPILSYANYWKPFKVHMDTSEWGLGAVLYQEQEDLTSRVIAFTSQSLSNSEKCWNSKL